MVTKSAIRPGSNFNRQGGSIFHQRQQYGSPHDGQHYRVHLCEPCFFRVLSGLRRERMVNGMFDDDQPFASEDFGLVSKDNYWEKN
ncbi:hypothetical protein [Pseudomonas aeruginosa]|uniref:hypothetical protein n=1 Tax=Pseudomonas aeruginosa TaxID=287 RepID=UPI002156179D|nr:hypothetical protein [Pseudomonas aeruginosa]